MDWFKVGTKYMICQEFTKSEKGAICELLAFVALHERIPSDREINKILSSGMVLSLSRKLLETYSSSLQEVLEKGLKDVLEYLETKKQNRERKQRQRDREKTLPIVTCDITLQKEKKEKKEKKEINTLSQIENLLEQFPSNIQKNIQTYFVRAAAKNKTNTITDGRKLTLLLELLNSYRRINNDEVFNYALEEAIMRDAACIGYVNAVIKNKLAKR